MRGNGYAGISLGSTSIGIRCSDRTFLEGLRGAYAPFLTVNPPEFWIDLELRQGLLVHEVNSLLPRLRAACDGQRLATSPRLIDCLLDRDTGQVTVATDKALFSPRCSYRLMNHLLRGAYYSIFEWKRAGNPDAYLVHGCGIASASWGYLFVGPSGTGKTTVARLSRPRAVLNDEAVLLRSVNSGFCIAGTPFDGGQPARSPAARNLDAIFFLKQGRRVLVRKLGRGEAYRMFLAQVFDSSPFFGSAPGNHLAERADLSASLVESVPCYELTFLPDESFWAVVEANVGKDEANVA